jgi:hypothetical protein
MRSLLEIGRKWQQTTTLSLLWNASEGHAYSKKRPKPEDGQVIIKKKMKT